MKRPHVTLLYHYFHPDDVVSARLFSDLAGDLAAAGWDVSAAPANRLCRDDAPPLPLRERWGGVAVRRVWRPALRQSSTLGRVGNALWMLAAWSARAQAAPRGRAVVVVGTDPIFSVLVAPVWKALRPATRVVHWCHDLYPEAAVADGALPAGSAPDRLFRALLRRAYRRCDVLADLGPCMAAKLAVYGSPARAVTLTPWSLVEPPAPPEPDPAARRELFGDAALGILYSGNFGRAHDATLFLELARLLRGSGVHFALACRGNRAAELRAAVTAEDTNVTLAGFAPEGELEKRLASCDAHAVSLRPEWTGAVVPSKFFGVLAAGRPVLFAGSPESAVARWIQEHRAGWVLTPETLPAVADELRGAAADPARLTAMRARCFALYHGRFSRARQMEAWRAELGRLAGR